MTAGHVSVVVPFRRVDARLERCVGALLDQEPPDGGYGVILVRNGSPDGGELARRYPTVTCLAEPRVGAYAARNRGAAAATGAVIAFLDADCVPERDWLTRLTARLRESGAAVAVGRIDPGGASRAMALVRDYEEERKAALLDGDRARLYFACGGNMAVRRDVWLAEGPFVERPRGADTQFVRELAPRHPRPVVYAPDARVSHLELRGVADYYRKAIVYGHSARLSLRADAPGRGHPLRERLAISGRAARRRRDAALLLPVLAAGRACWLLGYWSARLRGGEA